MAKSVRKVTGGAYRRVAKPVLFRRSPDKVHQEIIVAGRVVQKVPGVNQLPKLWSFQSPKLTQEIFGIRFRNPVGLAAGFDKSIEVPGLIRSVGFGFMTGGSVTAAPCAGNPKPWFYRLKRTKSLVVHAGLPNQGVVRIARRLVKYPAKLFRDMPLMVSVAKTNSPKSVSDEEGIADYCESLRLLERKKVNQLYEINISCPNAYGGQPFTTPKRLEALLAAIDQLNLKKPVFIKMPIDKNWQQFDKLLEVIVLHNVQGVAIGNLAHKRDGVDPRDKLTDDMPGGLSGTPTRDISTELIRQTYAKYGERLTIIGIGGIFSAEHAYAKIRAGASLVALISGMIFEGPQVVGDINSGLVQYLKHDNFAKIADAIGADHRN